MFDIEARVRLPDSGGWRAVVADDDPSQRAALIAHLSNRGFSVCTAADGYDAIALIGAESPSLVLLHTEGEDGTGDRAAALASMLYPHTRIILTAARAAAAADDGPFPVLPRPVDLSLLDRCLDTIRLPA